VQPQQFQQHVRQPSAAGATTSAAVPTNAASNGLDSVDNEPVAAAPSKPAATSNPKAAALAKKKAVHKDWSKSANDIEEILHFVRLNGGNMTAAVSKLRSLPHGRFQALAVSIVQGWLVPHQKKVQLLPQYQEALNRGKSFVAWPGRKPMLEKQDMGTAKGALKTCWRTSARAVQPSTLASSAA
jgi:hypothetical protein